MIELYYIIRWERENHNEVIMKFENSAKKGDELLSNTRKLWDYAEKRWVEEASLFTDDLVEVRRQYNKKTGKTSITYSSDKDLSWYDDLHEVDWNGCKVDKKIFPLIKWLNDSGYKTVYSCSGHLLKHRLLHTNDVQKIRYKGKILYERKDTMSHGYILFDRRYRKIEKYFKAYEKKRFGKELVKVHSYVKNIDLVLIKIFKTNWKNLYIKLRQLDVDPYFYVRKVDVFKNVNGKRVKTGKKRTAIYFEYCNKTPELQDMVLADFERMIKCAI